MTVRVTAAETLGLAMIGLWLAGRLHRIFPVLDRIPVPRSITGGLLLASVVAALRNLNVEVEFDSILRDLLMTAFFTTIGLGTSASLLKRGGRAVALCLLAAVLGAVVQNCVGVGLAIALGLNPQVGIIAGALTLAGGPATALAFAPHFEQLGVADAGTLALAAAIFGVLAGGMTGGAAGAFLIRRFKLSAAPQAGERDSAIEGGNWLHTLIAIVLAMAAGSVLSRMFIQAGITLPGYIGAMVMGAIVRHWDDRRTAPMLSVSTLGVVQGIALNLFIVMALLTLRLWVLGSMAGPMVIILIAQAVVAVLLAWTLVYRLLGRDYDAAVIVSGWCGFMLGTTANAVASMESVTTRYGPSQKAFASVPVVGAFLIDFTNSALILAASDLIRRSMLF